MVLQIAKQRADQVLERVQPARQPSPDRRLLSYATPLRPDIAEGFKEATRATARLAASASSHGARTAVVLVPARFQLDAAEYQRMEAEVSRFGFELDVDGANSRFHEHFAPLGLPLLDLLPAFRAAPHPGRMFFERTVHLTPAGHEVAAEAIARFLEDQGLVP